MIKRSFPFLLLLCVGLILSVTPVSASKDVSGDKVWREIDAPESAQADESISAGRYKTFRLDKASLRTILDKAPIEFSSKKSLGTEEIILTLPLPDGTFSRFSIQETAMMEPELAAKYPDIATYIGQGIDDPNAITRISLSPAGFRGIILSNRGTILVDPLVKNDTENYISYNKADAVKEDPFICESGKDFANLTNTDFDNFLGLDLDSVFVSSGSSLRTYRLALAATAEYTNAVKLATDTDAQAKVRALEQQVITMNRINGIFERDLSIRMIIVANNDLLIYTDVASDPYTNNNGNTMLGQNQTNIDTVIGAANYDIGHVFSTGGGGIATLRGPCGPNKARGVTGRANPVGEAFAIDYVAHEMGHQFGGSHTFNGAVSNCAGSNRAGSAAYEPGSGVTVMGYAGICGNQNLAGNSIDTFHVKSIEEIIAYISNPSTGGSCPVTTDTGNAIPTIALNGATSYNIPKQTPFALSATGSDANNDSITYDWQQYDLGASASTVPNSDSDGSARPLFRSYLPTTNGTRTFPTQQYVLNNANVPPSTSGIYLTGEILPSITRTMHFQVIARDNRAGGGGVNTAAVEVAVDGNSGPFVITAPNNSVTWNGGSSQTVTWNVANTTAAPVNAANVRITLSTDGGQTFPTVLANSTANDGSETIIVPNSETATARIKVEAVGNIFFDVADVNLTINATSQPTVKSPYDFDGDGKSDLSIFRPSVGEWWYLRSSSGGNNAFQFGSSSDKMVPADYTGDGKSDFAFWRPSTGEWFVLRSEDNSFYAFPFGAEGDTPAPADYDGDGKADPAVFRASSATWFIARSTGGTTIQQFGATGDVPAVADYDADGKSDLAIYRPALGQWWLLRSSAGVVAFQFGSPTDKPVQGDYTGDGRADVGFFRPSTGEWYILRSENNSFYSFPFGTNGDVAAPGDYDGDGKFDAAIFRPSNSTWFVQRSTSGTMIQEFGQTGDVPVATAFIP